MDNIINDKLFNEAQKEIHNLVNSDIIDQNTLVELYQNLTPSNAKDTIAFINKKHTDVQNTFIISFVKIASCLVITVCIFFGLTCLIEKILSLENNIYIDYSKNVTYLIGLFGVICTGSIGH